MLGNNKGAYTSQWSGYLSLQERKQVQFSFQGESPTGVELLLDGKVILTDKGKFGSKTSDSIQIDPGAHKLEINYSGKADGSGHVRLMWKSADSPLQSIPASYFKHQANDKLGSALKFRHGRDLIAQQNCTECHTTDQNLKFPELNHQGPDMAAIGSRVSEQWLAEWIVSPHTVKPSTTMPAMVDGSSEQGKTDAADIASYLATLTKYTGMAEQPATPVENDIKLGGGHFHALGCVSCHSLPNQAYDAKTDRMPLNRISQKYSTSTLAAFLIEPEKNHSSIKMPNFNLSKEEASHLAAFLYAESSGKAPVTLINKKGDAARGKELVTQLNCASCHENLPASSSKLPSFEAILSKSWTDHGCLPAKKPGKTPVLNLTKNEREAMESFRDQYKKNAPTVLSSVSPTDFATRQLKTLNCAACHQRDDMPSLLASLHSQSKHLSDGIPKDAHHGVDQSRPSLSYIGEMLHTDYMEEIIDGSITPRPRPWLEMRMPAFSSRAELLTKGLTGQHGMAPSKVDVANLDPEKIKIGKKLIGSNGGFACIICHADGGTKALAAFEVEGVNFDQVARRLRGGYYHKWMENPQSITPTTKMPRYTTDNKSPLPEHGGDAQKQFESILEYLKSLEAKKQTEKK